MPGQGERKPRISEITKVDTWIGWILNDTWYAGSCPKGCTPPWTADPGSGHRPHRVKVTAFVLDQGTWPIRYRSTAYWTNVWMDLKGVFPSMTMRSAPQNGTSVCLSRSRR